MSLRAIKADASAKFGVAPSIHTISRAAKNNPGESPVKPGRGPPLDSFEDWLGDNIRRVRAKKIKGFREGVMATASAVLKQYPEFRAEWEARAKEAIAKRFTEMYAEAQADPAVTPGPALALENGNGGVS